MKKWRKRASGEGWIRKKKKRGLRFEKLVKMRRWEKKGKKMIKKENVVENEKKRRSKRKKK